MLKMKLRDHVGTIVYWISPDFDPSRDTLFFLHGLTADHTMFSPQLPAFRDKYNIIVWDAPAHGQSRPYPDLTYDNAANAMKMILDKHGVSSVILVGQSMGGFMAQSFIARFPEYAKAFVSVDSTPFGDYYSESDMWWLRQIERLTMLYPEKLLRSSIANQNALTKHARANMKSMIACYTKPELCRLMRIGYAGFLDDNRELSIPCPVLLLVGKYDKTGKVKAYNREWSKRTGFPLVWIPGAAHNSNVDAPTAVNKEILRFITSI